MGALRTLSVLVATWLFASAFLWPESPAQFHNTWVVGVLAMGAALAAALGSQGARKVGFALGLWLAASTLLFPGPGFAVLVNNIVVAAALVVTALLPDHFEVHRERYGQVHDQGPFGPTPGPAPAG